VYVSKDGGGQWTSISAGLPQNLWISSITPSPHHEGTVFLSLNAYREDNFSTFVYESQDYGKTWTSVKGNLPESVANVIIQDPVNPDLLYCGLDNGTYVSLDRGKTWQLFNVMLNVASYDMTVHPRDNELIVGTHGRSIFVADVKPLQDFKNGGQEKPLIVYAVEPIRHSDRWGEKQFGWSKANLPSIKVLYYVGKPTDKVQVEIVDEKNIIVRKLNANSALGFHYLTWDIKVDPVADKPTKRKKQEVTQGASKSLYAAKGKYKVRFISGSQSAEVPLEIK
jgi:hypothetical protein